MMVHGRGKLLDINDEPIGDASSAFEPGAAFALDVVGALRLAAQQNVGAQQGDATCSHQSIQPERIHKSGSGESAGVDSIISISGMWDGWKWFGGYRGAIVSANRK